MTDKQFEFIIKSLKSSLRIALRNSEIRCELNPNHPDPNYQYRFVIDSEIAEMIINRVFAEVMEGGAEDDQA